MDTLWHKWLRRPYRLNVVADVGNPHSRSIVVLLHGIASEGNIWRPLVQRIDVTKHRVIVLDLLGFGMSPRPVHARYDVNDHAEAVLKTLRGLAGTHNVTIMAHSMGCLIASHLATKYPQLAKRLILYEPPLFADDPAFRSHRRRASRYIAFYSYLAAHPELLMLQHRRLYRIAQRVSGLVLGPETWLPFERSLKNTIMRQQAYEELHAIKLPTDIVHGRLDMVVIRTEVKKMFQDNPHITLHTVTAFHDITPKAAAYLNALLETPPQRRPQRTKPHKIASNQGKKRPTMA